MCETQRENRISRNSRKQVKNLHQQDALQLKSSLERPGLRQSTSIYIKVNLPGRIDQLSHRN